MGRGAGIGLIERDDAIAALGDAVAGARNRQAERQQRIARLPEPAPVPTVQDQIAFAHRAWLEAQRGERRSNHRAGRRPRGQAP